MGRVLLLALVSLFIWNSKSNGLEVEDEYDGSEDATTPINSIHPDLCKLETGLSSIIVDIEESLGDDTSQKTVPEQLPVVGDPWREIELTLLYPTSKHYFRLDGKKLKLTEPLDRDTNDISSIVFQLVCNIRNSHESRTIPIIARVSDLNDNSPQFMGHLPYEVTVSENTPVKTPIFNGVLARDVDAGVNGLVEYSIVKNFKHRGQDGYDHFAIDSPHHGTIILKRNLDYEKNQEYFVTIVASDRSFKRSQRRSSTATLTVHVEDADDLPPRFEYDQYNASVTMGVLTGVLDIMPHKIQAKDLDSIDSKISYSLHGADPNFDSARALSYFSIDEKNGIVRQIAPIDNEQETRFDLLVKATEQTPNKRSSSAVLTIYMNAIDSYAPVLEASSLYGYVAENSANGTVVLSAGDHKPIRFAVYDKDLQGSNEIKKYRFELTTAAFRVNEKSILVVNDENLDRDPPKPSELNFQIIVREAESLSDKSTSLPLVVKVKLIDINDNTPIIGNTQPITVPGGDGKSKRKIAQIEAFDKDEGDNGSVKFSISHISNNGTEKFVIDEETGIISAVGSLHSGNQYSITVQATDGGGRSSQSIVEIKVSDGPNLKPPVFSHRAYEVGVSEGASVGAEVIVMKATDPEGKRVIYGIIGGNQLKHFRIDKNTGLVSTNGGLDREDVQRYGLTIKAEDEGGLYSTATLNIRVIDINDRNPVFLNTPYEFSVMENKVETFIGQVHAEDLDSNENGLITYEIPRNIPFHIDGKTGEIFTSKGLDYEHERKHLVVVTARDNAEDPRIATATVTIHVEDEMDEVPQFRQFSYEVSVPENVEGVVVGRVEAIDPDTNSMITYTIKKGAFDKFRIDRETGEVWITQGLDYEREPQHILIIGTEENESDGVGATTTFIINVLDVNDVPPIFNVVPRPITIEDTAQVGTVVTKLHATDSDGSSPFNEVKYELFGRDKAMRYFDVDHDSGEVRLKDDLRKEMDTQYTLNIRAYDVGSPVLSSEAAVKINVEHVATVPPELGLGFSESFYIAELKESAVEGTKVKTLTVINKPTHIEGIPIECSILNHDEETTAHFAVTSSEKGDCELILKRTSLDFERKTNYEVIIEIKTLPGIINKKSSVAKVKVKIVDENDNTPEFTFPEELKKSGKLFLAVSEDAEIGTPLVQVQAEDRDRTFNEVTYELKSNNKFASNYFEIGRKTGIVRNKVTLEDTIGSGFLPFHFEVVAKDSGDKVRLQKMAYITINILNPKVHRFIMKITNKTPNEITRKQNEIKRILKELSKMEIGVEKIVSQKYRDSNNKIRSDPLSSDVYLYAIDPKTGYVIEKNRFKKLNLTKDINYFVSSTLDVPAGVDISYEEDKGKSNNELIESSNIESYRMEGPWTIFPAALVALGCLIFFISVASICFICHRFKGGRGYQDGYHRESYFGGSSVSKHEPFYIDHTGGLRPQLRPRSIAQQSDHSGVIYETQVLNMRVTGDEAEIEASDLQLDLNLSRNHIYSEHGSSEPGSSPVNFGSQGQLIHDGMPGVLKTFQTKDGGFDSSVSNPIYQRSDDDDLESEEEIRNITNPSNRWSGPKRPTTEL